MIQLFHLSVTPCQQVFSMLTSYSTSSSTSASQSTFSLSHHGRVFIMSASFSMSVSPFCKMSAILTCQHVSIPVGPSHEQVFIMSASFSMSVSPFCKMSANFNMSASQYTSQSKS